jgi:hypothetical protein
VIDIIAGVTKIWLGETPFDGRSPEGTLKKMDMSKCSANGVKGDGMFGEPNSFPCGIRDSIRWKAESLTEAGKEVGDAHSSDLQDERDNITLSEQRGVSLKMTVKKTR